MTAKDKLILVGQVLAHAKRNKKVLTEHVLGAIAKCERKAQAERMTSQTIDDYIKQGKEIYNHKEGYDYGNTGTTKYLL